MPTGANPYLVIIAYLLIAVVSVLAVKTLKKG